MKVATFLIALSFAAFCLAQQPPAVQFHLTARPWKPLKIPRDAYLDSIEGICRFTAKHLGPDGEVIDPLLKREHQYSTPYFAVAVGTLVRAGRAKDVLPAGVAAMDHATACVAERRVPDNHGDFFIPALAEGIEIYEGLAPAATIARWRGRLKLPVEQIIRGQTNNWRAYAMRGQWLRAKLGLITRNDAVAFIEDGWTKQSQRERIANDALHLYQDRGTDPESHAVDPVGRGNLLGLVAAGYDGPAAAEMTKLVEAGTRASLLLEDPTGQCPPDGRADDHVFNDVLYLLCFDVMAERARAAGDDRVAGQFRHAAMLALKSIDRWRRTDSEWAGSYFITKNHFDPAKRVGYQTASNITNYNGAVALHLAEAYRARASEIDEQPASAEIGGYAFATDPKFASAVADAGGMQLFAALRGDTKLVYDHYWTSLGVNRFARVGWETRLGPSDGTRDAKTGRGVTFAPTWEENGKWIRLADVPDRYAGRFSVQFAHPLLVRCAIDYRPIAGKTGPRFRHEFLVTPDGVLATLRSDDATKFGVTLPLLEDDGAPLKTRVKNGIATTAYDSGGDEECFLSVGGEATLDASDEPVLSTYGYLRPLRALSPQTFIYPRNAADPSAEAMRSSIRLRDDGFDSAIAKVHGTIYVGRTSAGGEGDAIDIDGDGKRDAAFDQSCKFILQLKDGTITAVEADRAVTVTLGASSIKLDAFKPVTIDR